MQSAVEMAPIKPFKNSLGALPPDKPKPRPTNLGEARAMIAEIYEMNGWDESDISRYHAILGLPNKPLAEFTKTELTVVVADLENSRMLLLQ